MTNALKKLDKAIKEAKAKAAIHSPNPEDKQQNTAVSGINIAYRICVEMFAGVLAGGLLGYYLDLWLDTKPFLFMLCLVFGIIGSGLNIFRMVNRPPSDDAPSPPEE